MQGAAISWRTKGKAAGERELQCSLNVATWKAVGWTVGGMWMEKGERWNLWTCIEQLNKGYY